jgi:elongation factor 1-alpha
MSEKEHLSLVVCGHVDAGKSTTCGHLIFKCGGITEREMAKLQEMAEEKGKSSFGFAYYLDTCKEERERGVTIQCNTKEFFTDKYHYTIVDAPGHKDYIKVCLYSGFCVCVETRFMTLLNRFSHVTLIRFMNSL